MLLEFIGNLEMNEKATIFQLTVPPWLTNYSCLQDKSRALTCEMKVSKESEAPNKETREEQSKLRPKGNSPSVTFKDFSARNLLYTFGELITYTIVSD
jgi:hypothetical protein